MTPDASAEIDREGLAAQVSNVLEGVEWNGPTDAFYEHAVKAKSQYDEQYRQMAQEILAARQALRACLAALRASAPSMITPDDYRQEGVIAAAEYLSRNYGEEAAEFTTALLTQGWGPVLRSVSAPAVSGAPRRGVP